MVIVRLLSRFFQLLAIGILGLGLWLWIVGHDVTLPAGQLWFQFDVVFKNAVRNGLRRSHPIFNKSQKFFYLF